MPTVQGVDAFDHGFTAGSDYDQVVGAGGMSAVTTPLYQSRLNSLQVVTPTAVTGTGLVKNITGAPTRGWVGFPLRIPSAPAGGGLFVAEFDAASGSKAYLRISGAGLILPQVGVTGGTPVAISFGSFHWIEMIFDVTGTTHTLYWRMDDINQTSISVAVGTASTVASVGFVTEFDGGTLTWHVGGYWARGSATSSSDWLGAPTTTTAPSAPQSPQATGGSSQVALSWSAPASNGGSAITAYKIYRSTSSGAETLFASPAGTGTTYTDNTTANGTTYFYKISAVNAIGESALSSEVFATPVAPPTGSTFRTFKRFYGPALLGNAAATLYTCPASATAVVRHVHVSNPTGAPVDFSLSIGTSAAGTRIWDAQPVPADDQLDHFQDFTLVEGEIIQGFAGSANTLNLTIDGYEVGVDIPIPIYPGDAVLPHD